MPWARSMPASWGAEACGSSLPQLLLQEQGAVGVVKWSRSGVGTAEKAPKEENYCLRLACVSPWGLGQKEAIQLAGSARGAMNGAGWGRDGRDVWQL